MLSKDYEPFGMFYKQILIISLLTIPMGIGFGILLPFLLNDSIYLLFLPIGIFGICFMIWGLRKQDKELFG